MSGSCRTTVTGRGAEQHPNTVHKETLKDRFGSTADYCAAKKERSASAEMDTQAGNGDSRNYPTRDISEPAKSTAKMLCSGGWRTGALTQKLAVADRSRLWNPARACHIPVPGGRLLGEDPGDETFDLVVGQGWLGWHRYLAPGADTTALHLGGEHPCGVGLTLVLGGDVFVGRSDHLSGHLMTGHAALCLGKSLVRLDIACGEKAEGEQASRDVSCSLHPLFLLNLTLQYGICRVTQRGADPGTNAGSGWATLDTDRSSKNTPPMSAIH